MGRRSMIRIPMKIRLIEQPESEEGVFNVAAIIYGLKAVRGKIRVPEEYNGHKCVALMLEDEVYATGIGGGGHIPKSEATAHKKNRMVR
jgi:hypothetical protein